MVERIVKASVVEPNLGTTLELLDVLREHRAQTAVAVDRLTYLKAFVMTGVISPATIDVLFLQPHLPSSGQMTSASGGLEVISYLRDEGIIRDDSREALASCGQRPDPDRIVVVGMGRDRDLAKQLGTYSVALGGPLAIEWPIIPLQLDEVIVEVGRLKPEL
jgi:hypothetical protein